MGKERSMTSVITMMQVLLFSMAAAVITVMAFGIAVQNHLQVRFMDRLEVSDRILEDLYVMEQDFREFGHEWGEESYSVYKEQVKQLENDLAEFREMSKDSSQTQNYIRRLNNFNIYQMEQIDRTERAVSHIPLCFKWSGWTPGGSSGNGQRRYGLC